MKKFPKAEYINVKKFSDIGSVYIKVFKDGEIIDKLKIYDGKEVDAFIEELKKRLNDFIKYIYDVELEYDCYHSFASDFETKIKEILELFEEEKEE